MNFVLISFLLFQAVLGAKEVTQHVVQEGSTFNLTCVTGQQHANVTWTLPTAVLNSTYFQNLSDLQNRRVISTDVRNSTTSLTVYNASHLDTGYYNCQTIHSGVGHVKPFEVHYVFVHPPNENREEILSDDLLLPSLDVYVLQISQPGHLCHFRPTHPDVQFYLLRKNNKGLWIEIYSNQYKAIEDHNWFFDKYHGLKIGRVVNETNGEYWCEAVLGNRITSRHFRIFVTTSGPVSLLSSQPRIKDRVDFRIFPTASQFSLVCRIGVGWNVSWIVPMSVNRTGNYMIDAFNRPDSYVSLLTVNPANYVDTGYYTCHRTDNTSVKSQQYVFITGVDHEQMLLPMERYYVLDANQPGVIPCRPSHPDIIVYLEKEAQTNRGFENITLFPSKDNDEWTYDKFVGFQTNVTRFTASTNYLCKGVNRMKVEQDFVFDILVADIELRIILPHKSDVIVDGDEVTLKCMASGMPTKSGLYLQWTNGITTKKISLYTLPSNRTKVLETVQSSQSTMQLVWTSVSFDAAGTYSCRYRDPRLVNKASKSFTMKVIAAKAPHITETSDLDLEVVEGSAVTLRCHDSLGAPPPTITWLYENQVVNETLYTIESFLNGTTTLVFRANDSGQYTCRFANRVDKDERHFKVVTIALDNDDVLIAVVVVFGIVAVVLVVVARIAYLRATKRHALRDIQDAAKCLEPLLAGNPSRINPYLPLDEQSELLPYDRRWEFPRSKLKFGQQLGAGCFGRVVLAEAEGIVQESVVETVAVKMVRSYANTSALVALVSELKILIHLGSHVNIVNLLGACTDVINGDFLVIVEYCRYDNLHNFIINHRHCFINQLDDERNLLPVADDTNSAATFGHQQGYMMMGALNVKPCVASEQPAARNSVNPAIDILSHESAAVMYRAQASRSVDPNQSFSTRDLICWGFQIARGMDYLSSRNVIHGDLAARNVLLADNSVAKIADFGLSRKVYQDSNYKKKSEGMLPVKWMAIESLTERIFSSQSDVWAFGVVLWELFSLGKAPFPEFEDIAPLIQFLESGSRMEIPAQAPNAVSQITKDCWRADPDSRPNFARLEQALGDLLEQDVRQFYVDLNLPYIKRNESRMNSSNTGYLYASSQQSTPSSPTSNDYINLSGLDEDQTDHNPRTYQRSETVTSDYLTMSAV